MKEFGSEKIIFDKMTAVRTQIIIQLLPHLLMEQFDTLPIQCRHIEHMHEGVYNFFCTDSTEIFFSKN